MMILARRGLRILGRRFAVSVTAGSFAMFLAATGLGVAPARSQDKPGPTDDRGVVELFTSQGCAKCPAADRNIAALARTPGLIALSFPVATWDYIGWKDTLASPAFAARQHAYADARGDQIVFTPQAIIDGVDVEAGGDKAAILSDMRRLALQRRAMGVPIELSEADGRLRVAIGAGALGMPEGGAHPIGVYVLRVARSKTVEIDRGANSGHSITYTNVVRAMTRIGAWVGTPIQFDMLELKGDGEGYVVLLQDGTQAKPGIILAAAKEADL